MIAIDETYGQIKDMGARYTSVVTRDNTEYLIPNEDLITSRVINWSYSSNNLRIKIDVGVAYDADLNRVREVMITAARNTRRVLADPQPICQVKDFGRNAIDMQLRFWIKDPENSVANVSSDIRMAIWEASKANGIEIPFPQRVLHMANDQVELKSSD